LIDHFAVRERSRRLNKAIGKGRLSMIYVCDNGKIANRFNWFGAHGPETITAFVKNEEVKSARSRGSSRRRIRAAPENISRAADNDIPNPVSNSGAANNLSSDAIRLKFFGIGALAQFSVRRPRFSLSRRRRMASGRRQSSLRSAPIESGSLENGGREDRHCAQVQGAQAQKVDCVVSM
jgi:hypothetical protein